MKAFDYGVQLISHYVDSPVENLVVVNDEGKVVYEQVGDKESISVPDEVVPLFRNCHVFHNHPIVGNRSGRHLSNRDIAAMIDTDSKSVTSVARHNGKVVVTYMEQNKTSTASKYSALFGFTRLSGLTPRDLETMDDDDFVKVCNKAWRKFAKENNLKYKQYTRRTK